MRIQDMREPIVRIGSETEKVLKESKRIESENIEFVKNILYANKDKRWQTEMEDGKQIWYKSFTYEDKSRGIYKANLNGQEDVVVRFIVDGKELCSITVQDEGLRLFFLNLTALHNCRIKRQRAMDNRDFLSNCAF